MSNDTKVVYRADGGAVFAPLWLMGWLYTLGYLHLHLPKAFFAVFIWPYYLGQHWGK